MTGKSKLEWHREGPRKWQGEGHRGKPREWHRDLEDQREWHLEDQRGHLEGERGHLEGEREGHLEGQREGHLEGERRTPRRPERTPWRTERRTPWRTERRTPKRTERVYVCCWTVTVPLQPRTWGQRSSSQGHPDFYLSHLFLWIFDRKSTETCPVTVAIIAACVVQSQLMFWGWEPASSL